MIDREPLKRAQKAWRKRQNEAAVASRVGSGRFGPSEACLYAVNGRMIGVRERVNGESRWKR
jgi:hypothetical protein